MCYVHIWNIKHGLGTIGTLGQNFLLKSRSENIQGSFCQYVDDYTSANSCENVHVGFF